MEKVNVKVGVTTSNGYFDTGYVLMSKDAYIQLQHNVDSAIKGKVDYLILPTSQGKIKIPSIIMSNSVVEFNDGKTDKAESSVTTESLNIKAECNPVMDGGKKFEKLICDSNEITDKDFQKELLKKLRTDSGKGYYEASVYTVLLDLVEGNDLETVFSMLHNVATDKGAREELEGLYEASKKYEW